MRLIGWAIALAAAGLTPAAAQAPQSAPAQTTTSVAQPGPAGTQREPATAPVAEQSAAAGPTTTATPPGSYGAFKQTPAATDRGVPIKGGKGIQEQVTPIGREAARFHNVWLMIVITAISLFVLALLLYTIVRYRRGAHPTPSRNSHNTTIEVLWTVVPVLILVAIAIPSIRLLRHQYSPPPADLTVKVTGHQWYWTYDYPDHGVSFDSYMLKEGNDPTRQADQRARTDADGPPLLAVDQRMVIPQGAVVKFIVTADDVIHAFAVPAFWAKIDANPGQLNEIWVKADKPGVYFGQCSELCGARHAYMPIAVEVVPPAQFAAWVASKGGTPPGARAAGPDSTAASPVSAGGAGGTQPNARESGLTTPAPAVAGAAKGPAPAPQNPDVANRATAND